MTEENKTVCVPVVDGRILENATGTDEGECAVNLSLIELTDDEFQRVEFKQAILSVDVEGDTQ